MRSRRSGFASPPDGNRPRAGRAAHPRRAGRAGPARAVPLRFEPTDKATWSDHRLQHKDPEQVGRELRSEGKTTDAKRNGLADALVALLEFLGSFLDLAAKSWLQRGPEFERGADQRLFLGHRYVGVGPRLGKQPQGLVVRQPVDLAPSGAVRGRRDDDLLGKQR